MFATNSKYIIEEREDDKFDPFTNYFPTRYLDYQRKKQEKIDWLKEKLSPKKKKKSKEKIEVQFNTPSKVQICDFITPKQTKDIEESLKKIYKNDRSQNKFKFLSHNVSNDDLYRFSSKNIPKKSYINNENYDGFKNLAKNYSEKIKNVRENFGLSSKYAFEKKVEIDLLNQNAKKFELSDAKAKEEKRYLKNFNEFDKMFIRKSKIEAIDIM